MEEQNVKSSLRWDQENKIARAKIGNPMTEKDARDLFDTAFALMDELKEKYDIERVNLLVDLSEAGKVDRKVQAINAMYFKRIKVDKVAIIGAHGFRALLVKIIYHLAKQPYRAFDNEKEAVLWLRNDLI